MLHSLNRLGPSHAADGDIGEVTDSYFDDERWVVRYLVVSTGGWLRGRDVLISPYSITAVDDRTRAVVTALTRAQVQESPSIDTAKPISRRQEAAYLGYYGYPLYWPYTTFWAWGALPVVMPPVSQVSHVSEPPAPEAAAEATEEVHLRSAREVSGYHIRCRDESIGHVEDFLFEDDTWAIRYLVVDTRNWLPGKQVLLSTQWITGVSWAERVVSVDLPRAAIESSPEYDPEHLPTRDEEALLHGHYARPTYWENYPPAR
ncbi:MAG TPA: PRC-barrel domain-containing protein [Steroidobacteraceae bacterium]|nr:PRC-barrel domain-containing protein [Steroidobacteraceae bacterium]